MVEFDFYTEILEESEDLEVTGREMEVFMGEDSVEVDFWARVTLSGDNRQYRVTFTEDHSPRYDRTNYELKISEKKPLSISDGWTNWRRIGEETYDSFKQSSFKSDVVEDISEYLPIEELDIKQSKLVD